MQPTLTSSQRGALFGLDARIALGIFAVMAVIATVVAYGRITTAKQVALVAELTAIDNALLNYQTDMGTFFLFTLNKEPDDTSSLDDITALWNPEMVKEGFRKNWNGPYLMRETRRSREFGNYSFFYAQPDRKNYCTTTSACHVWVSLTGVPAEMWDKVNTIFDEAGGKQREEKGETLSTGRVQADAATSPRALFFRGIARPQL